MRGTLLNVGTVLVGSGLGLVLGGRLPERMRRTVLDTLGLFTVVLGVAQALEAFGDVLGDRLGRAAVPVIIGSLLVGAVVGELLDLDARLEQLGGWLRSRTGVERGSAAGGEASAAARARFVEGFVVASLVFCVGPLTVLGAIRDGLVGDIELLAVKSVLDGFAALAFASALGVGVAFSALTVLGVQGAIALSATAVSAVLTEPVVAAMTATGGVLIVGIGLRLLDLRQVRVANVLPAIVVAPAVVALWPG